MGLILLSLAAWANRAKPPAAVCVAWDEAGPLTDAEIDVDESSGVAASTVEEGLYYTLNDAGGDRNLYLFDELGATRALQLVVGATNTDWEDLASGPCPGGGDCLYIADIGDNDDSRGFITIWIVPESAETIVDAVGCDLVYEDGPRDAEALLVDPSSGVVRIATKEDDGEVKIYKVDALSCGDEPDVLVREAEITLDGAVTGGVMTQNTVVLRTLSTAWVWQACDVATIWPMTPVALDLGEDPQGEAIGVRSDGGFITTSESSPFRFRIVPCAETGQVECPKCGCSSAGTGTGTGLVMLLWAWACGRRHPIRQPPTPPWSRRCTSGGSGM